MLVGQKALGWVAVLLGLFAAAFFLRYAYDNKWIGPQGQVAIGEAIGLCLAVAGLRDHRQGWRLFAQMLSACGIAVLYLSTYSAFGFYHLLPHAEAGGFLLAVVALSMLAAVLYNSPAIARWHCWEAFCHLYCWRATKTPIVLCSCIWRC